MSLLRAHLEKDVLEWWSSEGADDALGGVHTCFSNRGELLSREKYTWSQGRWAWTCALVAEEIDLGRVSGDSALWRERSARTAAFLADHAFLPDGRTSFRLDDHGRHLADEKGEYATSVFADLFAVLGLAGAARTSAADPRAWIDQATRTLEQAAVSIRRRTAKSEPYPVPTGFRDLAGPMTLLHVAGELERAAPNESTRRIIDQAHHDLLGDGDTFLGADHWWEFLPDRPSTDDTLLARHVTPGHLLELLWMLVHVADRSDQITVPDALLTSLALRALETGWDQQEGGLLRYTDREDGGRPVGRLLETPYEALVQRTWDTKLWWVHAEAVYATSLLAQRTASPELASWARRVREYTFATFPDPDGREWIQIRTRDGQPLDDVVALPVKDPMHIARSLLLLNALETPRTTEETPR